MHRHFPTRYATDDTYLLAHAFGQCIRDVLWHLRIVATQARHSRQEGLKLLATGRPAVLLADLGDPEVLQADRYPSASTHLKITTITGFSISAKKSLPTESEKTKTLIFVDLFGLRLSSTLQSNEQGIVCAVYQRVDLKGNSRRCLRWLRFSPRFGFAGRSCAVP